MSVPMVVRVEAECVVWVGALDDSNQLVRKVTDEVHGALDLIGDLDRRPDVAVTVRRGEVAA